MKNVFKGKKLLIAYLLAIFVEKLVCAKIILQRLPGFVTKDISNTSMALMKIYENQPNENFCFFLCLDQICSMTTYNKAYKKCYVNYYGRVILKPDPNGTCWIKSKSEILLYC